MATVNPLEQRVKMFWKKSNGESYHSLSAVKNHLEKTGQKPLLLTNGGMYLNDGSPQGWYVEGGKELRKIDTLTEAYGNFYMQPNGVFFIDKENKGHILPHSDFNLAQNYAIQYATQSGPMLLINSEINTKFKPESSSVYIRNGVGIKSNGELVFIQCKEEVNLYTFASYFLEQGCTEALYLDGFVSRMYAPSSGITQLDGNFGVVIAVVD